MSNHCLLCITFSFKIICASQCPKFGSRAFLNNSSLVYHFTSYAKVSFTDGLEEVVASIRLWNGQKTKAMWRMLVFNEITYLCL